MATDTHVTPKVFISYSWSSPRHQAQVQQWAEQLLADGVDVILDVYDLKEGHDKFAFMERMVTDNSVTHVLVFSDLEYARKADARKAGVGTESQIISKEVYDRVEQSKFIPIACEFDDEGNPYLPTFLKSRIWIDFSTPEAANSNWERLVRLLHGKPAQTKPERGEAPAYIREEHVVPASPAISKFNTFKQALLQGKQGLALYRRDFLGACIAYADSLRVREQPTAEPFGQKVLDDWGKLMAVRNHATDWVLLESEAGNPHLFTEALLSFLEQLLELKGRPPDVSSWNDAWFEAHSVFVYETFLYVVAALIKTGSFDVLHEVFTSHYLLSEAASSSDNRFDTFDAFYGYSESLQILAPESRRLYSPAAELVKRQANRADISFDAIMEAELLVLLMSFINPEARWYPQTLLYARGNVFPLFLRATQLKHFQKIAAVTGIADPTQLREAAKQGQDRIRVDTWHDFALSTRFLKLMNMDALGTVK